MTEKGSLAKLGSNNPMFGKRRSEEWKRKMLQIHQGKPRSEEIRKKISLTLMGRTHPEYRNENHYNWKGDNVSRHCLHKWVRRHLPAPDLCEICKIKPHDDLANITGKYTRDFSNWKYLCTSCHMKHDNIIVNLKHYGRKKLR